jgi:prophage antirepressor-like protein
MVSSDLSVSASAPLSFSFDQSFSVRVVMRDGDPWFVAADVCDALGIDVTAIRKLDDDEKGLHSMQTPGGIQEMSVINESGLYTMILRCRDATKAGTIPHKFRKWVTSDVLPSIRKTGGYQMPKVDVPVTLETINSAGLRQLAQIVYLIRAHFHMEGQAGHAAYAHLRKRFGLEHSVSNLPAIYFDQAVQILTELERLSFQFKGIVIEAERKFFRQVLRSGKALDEDAFNALFDAELQQVMESHNDALKLLN